MDEPKRGVTPPPARLPLAIVVAGGALLWIVASFAMGAREPWDRAAYWTVVYPLALAGCAGLGFAFPYRTASWAFALFLGQFVGLLVRNGELGGLWPLGLALFAVLALPGMVLAKIGARMRGRHEP
jgi:hypothetical protein